MIPALAVAAAGSFLLILGNIYPGVLDDLLFLALLTSCFWLPVAGLGGLILLVRFVSKPDDSKGVKPGAASPDDFAGSPAPLDPPRRLETVLASVLILNLTLWATNVPRRLAFAISRPAFEPSLANAPASPYAGAALNRRLGLYHVDRVAADRRGGVYFRTHAGSDGISPDTMSYGFAFQPNPDGTPFGRAGYGYSHLFGDWYSFNASNDY